ncbi:response regulator [Aliiglaciecola sp. LCG003]|uniref:response regulator transcription factor n=1 Tax=Aliiglaciecola sp. LCG003 TaxID=3053655 RepID=UPI0025724B79|nr:response regulator [Aliiglaciecola sp. LCG003]WJG07688.1 response regulator [Aliiglaciecola sp. LCG003]
MKDSASSDASPRPIVHLVDDDEAVLDSMALLLDSVGIDNCVYPNAIEFLSAFDNADFNHNLGCIVLDIRMPIMSGIECQHKLKERKCLLPLIFVTGHGDIPLAVQAMKNGALEFIQKPFREQVLIEAVQQALTTSKLNHHKMINIELTQQRLAMLTTREKQVLAAIVDGKVNKVIANEIHLSQRTVEIHRARVMDKMAASSLAHLIKMVLDAKKSTQI